MNYFAPNSAAERYVKGRPDFHPNTIQQIKAYLKLETKLNKVLDIACGTGLSTQALLEIGTFVCGTDSSKSMLALALQKDKVEYRLANAEEQPFDDNLFDLITVGSAVHWFDIDSFLQEANRLLKNKMWLIIYDNFFLAEMDGKPEFKNWYETVYLNKFPAPTRNDNYNWATENLKEINFDALHEESFSNNIFFAKKELALYLTTQSNIISAVELNQTSYQEVDEWLNNELSSFFENENQTMSFKFGNWIKYLQKII